MTIYFTDGILIMNKTLDLDLIKLIVQQVKDDEENEDYTAIDSLLREIDIKRLYGFLSDGKYYRYQKQNREKGIDIHE